MIRYTIQRILMMIPVLLGVTLIIFALQYLPPGDPARLMLGDEATEEDNHLWNEKNGLNDPFLVQYGKYLWNIVAHGSFGTSWRTGQEITDQVVSRCPTTFLLAILTTAVSVVIGVGLGILAAMHRDTRIDSSARFIGMAGIPIPAFWFAMMLIVLRGGGPPGQGQL